MAHTDTPHRISEVAIVLPVGDSTITTAHKPISEKVNKGTEKKPAWQWITTAECSKAPATSLSYAYALTRGAAPCTTCWGPE